ncbi:hypothetical protein EMPG_12008 [Blastomyces silverae]|uniref:Uncharacterized protein n=1 Tax=Blastomyces silverae TaxID=2060906 RepID=A0A0H1BPJ7_9EURO|nr:hypothetical protein EMPG_12008 [Blastomyces silverae]
MSIRVSPARLAQSALDKDMSFVARSGASIRIWDSNAVRMHDIYSNKLVVIEVLCVAKDNSCCDDFGGPGVTGTADGTPLPTSLYTPSHTPTGTPFSFDCYRGESGEKCCSKSQGLIYCPSSGEFPNIKCYHPTEQICCSDGTVCSGEGCCDLVNASPITPTATIPGTGGVPMTEPRETSATTVTSESNPASTPTTSNVAAMKNVVGGMAPAAVGILGLAAWL